MHIAKYVATSLAAATAVVLLSSGEMPKTQAQSKGAATGTINPTPTASGRDANPAPTNLKARHIDLLSNEQAFVAQNPGTRINTWQGASSVFGKSFAHGNTFQEAVENFRVEDLNTLLAGSGVQADELKPYIEHLPAGVNSVDVMYKPDTDSYKFKAFYFTQERNNVPVFGTAMTLLVRNEANHPLVLADFHVRALGNYQVSNTQLQAANADVAVAAVTNLLPQPSQILREPKLVVFAGLADQEAAPTLAYEIHAEGGDFLQGNLASKRFVVDASNGRILYEDSLIHDVDVSGNVSGMSTTGHGADICGGIASMPMPYARVAIGANFVYADSNGNFTIPNAGNTPVTVDAEVRGQYFRVVNTATPGGGNSTLSQVVNPPGPANFLFNNPNDPTNTGQYKRAEVNAYIHSNKVRDMVLASNPTFNTIANETNFLVNVNINTTCNAFYSSANQSINFYVAGGSGPCTNTANSTVVHHEYGHRIVNAAGSGQGAYGEGYSDCIAVILTDQPCLGQGFSPGSETTPCGQGPASCSGCLRYANNTVQYTPTGCSSCGSAIHSCGRLISGCVWSTRNYLAAAHPATYLQTIRDLTINSSLLHTPTTNTGITPQITVHFLTLDDDDNDINNGTPHYNQINAGFTDHNMPGPVLNPFSINATPDTQSVCAPANAVYTINIGQVGNNTNPVTLSVSGVPAGANASFSVNPVTPGNSSVLTISNTANATPGAATLQINGSQGQIGLSKNVGLYISTAGPGNVALSSPPNGALDVPVVPNLTWTAATQAQSYLVQIATDAGFTNIVHSGTVAGTSYSPPSALNTLTVYRWRVKAMNGCGESAFSSVFSFRTMEVPAILLVDDDDNGPNVLSYYTAALNALGMTYDVWDTGNTTQNEPTYAQIAAYKVIIWFSGDSFGGSAAPKAGPKAATDTAIQQWLDNDRGCLFLVSQDYLYDRIGSGSTTPNAYMQQYLGMATGIAHDRNYTSITGGFNLFAGYSPWTLTYTAASGGPGMSNFSDLVNPNANGLMGFTFQTATANGGGAITRDGGHYRTSFWGFPWEAIPTAADRMAIMSTVINWCSQLNLPCPGDVNNDDVVNVGDLLAVIQAWGPCPAPPELCPCDGNADDQVNVADLLGVIQAWGACP